MPDVCPDCLQFDEDCECDSIEGELDFSDEDDDDESWALDFEDEDDRFEEA